MEGGNGDKGGKDGGAGNERQERKEVNEVKNGGENRAEVEECGKMAKEKSV